MAAPPIITPMEGEAPPPAAPMTAAPAPETPVAEEAGPPPFPVDELEARLRAHLAETDVTSTTLKEIRKQVRVNEEEEECASAFPFLAISLPRVCLPLLHRRRWRTHSEST